MYGCQTLSESASINGLRFPHEMDRHSEVIADFLRQCLTASKAIPSLQILNDVNENKKMQEKLPEWTLHRWAKIIVDYKKQHDKTFPPFEKFVAFISNEANTACDSGIIQQATREKRGTESSNVLQTSVKEPAKESVEKTKTQKDKPKIKWQCFFCKEPHHLDTCEAFLKKSLEERYKYVSSERLCFGCLGKNHSVKKCKWKRRYKVCRRPHPTSLHGKKPEQRPENSPDSTKTQRMLKKLFPSRFLQLSAQPTQFSALQSGKDTRRL